MSLQSRFVGCRGWGIRGKMVPFGKFSPPSPRRNQSSGLLNSSIFFLQSYVHHATINLSKVSKILFQILTFLCQIWHSKDSLLNAPIHRRQGGRGSSCRNLQKGRNVMREEMRRPGKYPVFVWRMGPPRFF